MFVDHAKLLSAFTWTSPAGGVYVPEGYPGEESATVSQVNTLTLMNDAVSLRNVFNAKRAMFIKQLIHFPDIVFMKFIFQVLKWACFVDYNSLYVVNVDIVTGFFV